MNYIVKRAVVWCLAAAVCICGVISTPTSVSAKDYSGYSTKKVGWGLNLNKEHKTPSGSLPYAGFSLKNSDAYYVGDTSEKVIYLTFDCGYENGNTESILNTLKKYDIKAIFFVTKYFVTKNPKLVKRMKEEGHLVGNHTVSHPDLATCSVEKIQSELSEMEKVVKEKTGYEVDKFMRPPMGSYSEKTLKVIQDMGYKTIFWSLAWKDWDTANQPSVDYVVSKFKTYHHNGMIPLIHNTSSADTKALPKIIDYMLSQGYEFERMDNYFKEDPVLSISVENKIYDAKKPIVEVTTNSDGKQKITYMDLDKNVIKAPKNVGTYYVRVEVAETSQYCAAAVEKKFKITKKEPVVKAKMLKTIYEGDSYEPTVRTRNTEGEVLVLYYDMDGKRIRKPKKAGNYQVKVKVKTAGNYKSAYSDMVTFTIHEKKETADIL